MTTGPDTLRPLAGSRIIFNSHRAVDGTSNRFTDLFSIDPDGTGLVRLTRSKGVETYPSFSTDGEHIAFMMDFRIYVMNADGSRLRRLAAVGEIDEDPAWSPPLAR